MSARHFNGLTASLLLVVGCASATTREPVSVSTTPQRNAQEAVSPRGSLERAELEPILRSGPAWLLRRVITEEVILSDRFSGWRILALPVEWSNIDLKAGDVVKSVNGQALERPEDLFRAWKQLATAKEISVSYERNGTLHTLVLPIHGAASEEVAKALDRAERPAKGSSGLPRNTIVIEADDSLGQ